MSTKTEVVMSDYHQRIINNAVARGAAWLDKRQPDWFRHILFKDLKMQSGTHCILGQLGQYLGGDDLSFFRFFGPCGPTNAPTVFKDGRSYYAPIAHLGLTGDQARHLGFEQPLAIVLWVDGEEDEDSREDLSWGVMNEAWKNEMRKRRKKS